MKNLLVIKLLFILLVVFTSCSSNSQNIKSNNIKNDDTVIKGQYIALIRNKTNINKIKKEFKPYGIVEFSFVTKNMLKISLENDPGLEEVKKIKEKFKQIEVIESDRIVRIQEK
ncbi:MAG: hypothetical protein WCQ47_00625 [bacterium]